MTVEVEHAVLSGFVSALRAAGEDLDRACASIPRSAGTAEASALLGDVLFTVSSVVAHLAFEADLIAERADDCATAYASTDTVVQERLSCLVDPGAVR